MMDSIAIIGASNDPAKYGNKAVRLYKQLGFTVYPINPRETLIEGLPVYSSISKLPALPGMVSIYLPPAVTLNLLDELARFGCKEIWLNPGSESAELVSRAAALGIRTIQACTLLAAESLARPLHPQQQQQ